MRAWICGMFFLFFAFSSTAALAADTIGHIQTIKGSATVIRGNLTLQAATGTALNSGDLIRTGKPGAVGIVMTDDTTISLGPNSEFSLQDYAFNPKEGKFSLVARITKGTFVYLSGLIAKLAPNAVQLIIPDATIAVRGTKLLVEVEQ